MTPRRPRGSRCFYCDVWLAPHLRTRDHVIPTSRGGTSDLRNLVVACGPCNKEKSCLTAEEYLAIRHDQQGRKTLVVEMQNLLLERRGTLSQGEPER